ncbi:MAG: ComEA family DNA-binding protein, partial [Gammaproteobacteria bacterium]
APVLAQHATPAPSSTPNKNPNAAGSASTMGAGPGSAPAAGARPGPSDKAAAHEKLDINTATVEQLQQLKGVGPARAEAIVKGRPYSGKNDLVRKKIVPQSVYDQIQDQIIARQKK